MQLYHGSNTEVQAPDLSMSRKYLDFGNGFYLTSNKDQAIEFSRKVVIREKRKLRPPGIPTVSIYEFDKDKAKTDLSVLEFNSADEEWFEYVINNRNGVDLSLASDIIVGPVANDDVYRVVDDYENGLLTREMAIAALKIKKLYNQYTIKTETALRLLHFISTEIYTEEK
jgi:hypothetical protein